MEFTVLGWPADEPTLRLDYRRFSYAGKFVTGNGIAVVRGEAPGDHAKTSIDSLQPLPDGLDAAEFDDGVLAAVAFNVDRTDSDTLWLRYLSVRRDLRGSGLQLGPRLTSFVTTQAAQKGYKKVRIAVNNVFSYHALYKAGFAFSGRETGLAELILERPAGKPAARPTATYQAGLDSFGERTRLSDTEKAFINRCTDTEPPATIPAVDSGVSNPRRSSE